MCAQKSRKRLQIGDTFEMRTSKGLGYFQYSHFHDAPPRYGYLVRVIPELFAARPADLAALVQSPDAWFQFVMLKPCIDAGHARWVGSFPVPEHAQPFPSFRNANYDVRTGLSGPWSIRDVWNDKESSHGVETLTPEQRRLPILTLVSLSRLAFYLVRGFSPAKDLWEPDDLDEDADLIPWEDEPST